MSKLLIALLTVVASTAALAEHPTLLTSTPSVRVAAANPSRGVMTHQVATLMQMARTADAQARRSGQAQDLAYARSLHAELASRGFGRQTVVAPVPGANGVLLAASQANVTQ